MNLPRILNMGLLLAAAGTEGSAGGPAPASGQQAHQAAEQPAGASTPQPQGQDPSPGASAAQPPGAGDNDVVSRAEWNELRAQLDAINAKVSSAPEPDPKAAEPPAKSGSRDELLETLNKQVSQLLQQQTSQQTQQRRKDLAAAALEGIPDDQRELAELALDGLIRNTGVSLDHPQLDVAKTAEQLKQILRTRHPSLFSSPGSPYQAVPAKQDGTYDWSGVRSLSEVPPGMIKHMPAEVYQRLRGMSGSGTLDDPGRAKGTIRPSTTFIN